MPQETFRADKASRKKIGMTPFSADAHIGSPRACVAFSFLDCLHWLREKLGALLAHRLPVSGNPHPSKFANKLGSTVGQ